MLKTRGWAGLRAAAIALGLCAWAAADANAAAMSAEQSASTFINYSTTGSVGLTGITGRNVVSFKVAGGSFTAPSAFSLGQFYVDALNSGEATTYDNTPFSITYLAQMVDGKTPIPNETPITLTGHLNGTFTGASQSSVVATFDPIPNLPFQTGGYLNDLSVLGNTVALVPSTTNNGVTTIQGQAIVTAVTAAPVPEPASIAVFGLATVGGLAVYRRRKARA